MWLINTHNGIKESQVNPINVEEYPAIQKHLDSHYLKLDKRTDKGDTPYNLRNCAYMEDFYKQKIVWGNLNLEAAFTIAEEGIFINAPSPILVPANKYLLAVLNSKLADYYIRSLGVTRNGGYFEYKPMFIEKLPVPINIIGEDEIESLIDKILIMNKNKESTKEIENFINYKIYEIYNLNDNEIRFIENSQTQLLPHLNHIS